MLHSAMTSAGYTQTRLAEELGVSPMSVSRWVRGEQSLPAKRARDIERILGLPHRALEVMETAPVPDFDARTAPTVLAWLLAEDSLGGHMGETLDGRIDAVAHRVGVRPPEVLAWAKGDRRIPLDKALVLMAECWPGMNPVVLRSQVAVPVDEAESVSKALEGAPRPLTYQSVLETLREASKRYSENPWAESSPDDVARKLDNGMDIPDALRARVETITEERL